jgi:hypothetical protein
LSVGRSERVSAITHKMIRLNFIIPTMLAVVLGILLAFSTYYFRHYSALTQRGLYRLRKPGSTSVNARNTRGS